MKWGALCFQLLLSLVAALWNVGVIWAVGFFMGLPANPEWLALWGIIVFIIAMAALLLLERLPNGPNRHH